MFWNPFSGDEDETNDDDEWEVVASVDAGSWIGTSAFRTHTITIDLDETANDDSDPGKQVANGPRTTSPKAERSSTDSPSPTTDPSVNDPLGPNTGADATTIDEPQPDTPSEDVPFEPEAPSDTDSTEYERGTFVFNPSPDFMQKLEARGLNGAHDRVETVYVLAGSTYTRPTDLFRLDDPEYYKLATPEKVSTYESKIASQVASLFPDDEPPKLLTRVHTHPEGSIHPSDIDKRNAGRVLKCYENAFETSNFEFFQAIHAYSELSDDPSPDDRHDPKIRSNTVSWRGEQYQHEFALYGPRFRNLRKVVIDND
jgi:hypothetical protein